MSWDTERSGAQKGGGGLTLIYKDSLMVHRWTPSVSPQHKYVEKERQWLTIKHGEQKCAFLHCYIACQEDTDRFIAWNEDLFMLLRDEALILKQEGFIILAMGDFNTRVGQVEGLENNVPGVNRNQPMFMNFITEVNLGMPSYVR